MDADMCKISIISLSVSIELEQQYKNNNKPLTFKAMIAANVPKYDLALNFPDLTTKEFQKCANSGISTYMYTMDISFSNCQVKKSKVQVSKGSTSTAPKIGKWHRITLNPITSKVLKLWLNKTLHV